MFYGFTAAWVIVLFYVISLARRGARLKKELENVKQLIAADETKPAARVEDRVRP